MCASLSNLNRLSPSLLCCEMLQAHFLLGPALGRPGDYFGELALMYARCVVSVPCKT